MINTTAERRVPLNARSRAFVITFAAVLAITALFLALDLFLARIDRSETSQHAVNLYRDGIALLASHHPSEAVDRLSAAVALNRSNSAYGLALAEAKIANNEADDAERMLKALLDQSPNNAEINFAMARLLNSSGRSEEAKAFYHRAIFGKWGQDSTKQRMNARFELIDLLSKQGAEEELLAELLPLQGMAGDSTMLLRRVAPLYVRAGSPERAVEVYKKLLKREPGDYAAYIGLSDAEMKLGRYRDARSDLSRGLRRFPDDSVMTQTLRTVDSALTVKN